MHLPFWISTALLSPVAIPLAIHTRRTTPRLPEASGAASGQWGAGEASRRLLVVGESTAAGVGCQHHGEGLASQLAHQLHQRHHQTVAWHTFGINGIRAAGLLEQLAERDLPDADAIFVSLGVNDTTGLTPRHRYRTQLAQLFELLGQRNPDAALYLLAVPPMHRFTALPVPLRQLLGWRARLLDQQHAQLANQHQRVQHLHYPPLQDPRLLASDGYHPSAHGYLAMATALAEFV